MKIQSLFIVLVFQLTSIVFAQTPEEAVNFLESENGYGVKAAAMGNAFVGVADDYTAMYWNPAGLTLLKSSEINGEFYYHRFNNEANFAENTLLENQNFTQLKSLGFAYKFPISSGSFAVAFGYNKFKDFDDFLYFSGFNTLSNGLGFDLEDGTQDTIQYHMFDKDVLQTEQVVSKGNLGAWSYSAGLALSPNFSVGATMNFYTGTGQYLFDFYQDDIDDVYGEFPANYEMYELHQQIKSKFSGMGVKLGGLFLLNDQVRIGLAVDLPSSLRILETYSANDVIWFDDETISEMDLGSGEWEYVVKYPMKFSGGIALDTKHLLLAGSFDYRDWSQVQFDIPEGYSMNSDFEDLLFENHFFGDLFRPVLSYSAGGELRVPGTGLKLRGGYRVVPSPFLDADKKFDRRYICAGFGYDIDDYSTINFSYVKGVWERNTVDSFTPGGTHESINTDRFLAGITYRF